MNQQAQAQSQVQENPLVSLLINVIIPYYVLTKAAPYLGEQGPTLALVIALAFPLVYGGWDYFKNKKANYISIFGLLNTLFTGGFALLQLGSEWFIVKEAAFPFLLGVVVLTTSFSGKPFIKYMFNFSQAMDNQLIEERLIQNNNVEAFAEILKKSNTHFAFSFFLSSLLNFLLAMWVFKDIDPSLPELEKAQALNQQIADMTWMGYIVIALPLMIFVFIVMMKLINGIKKLTGLEAEELFPSLKK